MFQIENDDLEYVQEVAQVNQNVVNRTDKGRNCMFSLFEHYYFTGLNTPATHCEKDSYLKKN